MTAVTRGLDERASAAVRRDAVPAAATVADVHQPPWHAIQWPVQQGVQVTCLPPTNPRPSLQEITQT